MKKIVFVTDLSEASKNASLYAFQMAEALDCKLVMLHIYKFQSVPLLLCPQEIKPTYTPFELERLEHFVQEMKQLRIKADALGYRNVQVEHVFKSGDAVMTIQEMVEKEDLKMFIMGIKRENNLKQSVTGSVSGATLLKTKVMVVGIPDGTPFNQVIDSVTFTTRFREKDKKAFEIASKMALQLGVPIRIVYIKTNETDVPAPIIQNWRDIYENEYTQVQVIENSNVNQGILDYLASNQNTLLTVLHYKRNFLLTIFEKSFTEKIAALVQVPVLIIQSDEIPDAATY